jgi:hypothetical protein
MPDIPTRLDVVRAEFARQPPAPGDEASWGEFTRRVARRLHAQDPNWGLVTKQPGEGQHKGYAIDVIAYRTPYRQVDILAGSNWPQATPWWGEIDPQHYRPGNVWAPPPPEGEPEPGDNVEAMKARIRELEAEVARLKQQGPVNVPTYDEGMRVMEQANAAYIRGVHGRQRTEPQLPTATHYHLMRQYLLERRPAADVIEEARKRGNNEPF